MCNSVSTIYSLYTNSKDLFKGNITKLPEVLIETNNVLHTVGNSKYKISKNIKNTFDYFIKDGFCKTKKFTNINLNKVSFVAGISNSLYENKDTNIKNKLLSIGSFLCGFGAKLAIEGIMDSKIGSKLLQQSSSHISNFATKPFSFLKKNTQNIAKAGTIVISGILYQVISDKVSEKVEDFANTILTQRR